MARREILERRRLAMMGLPRFPAVGGAAGGGGGGVEVLEHGGGGDH